MKIRVLRVIEYEFDDVEAYLFSKSRWTMQSPLAEWTYKRERMSSSIVSERIQEDDGIWRNLQ